MHGHIENLVENHLKLGVIFRSCVLFYISLFHVSEIILTWLYIVIDLGCHKFIVEFGNMSGDRPRKDKLYFLTTCYKFIASYFNGSYNIRDANG